MERSFLFRGMKTVVSYQVKGYKFGKFYLLISSLGINAILDKIR